MITKAYRHTLFLLAAVCPLGLFSAEPVWASPREVSALYIVSSYVALLSRTQPVTSLDQLNGLPVGEAVQEGARTSKGAWGDRYGFPSGELVLPGKGRVLVMATRPIRESGRIFRPLSYLSDAAAGDYRLADLSEEEAAALLAANPAIRLLPLGTKVLPPPSEPAVLTEEDEALQRDFLAGKIHIETAEEAIARHPEWLEEDKKLRPAAVTPLATAAPVSVPWLVGAAAALAVLALGWRVLRRK
jgi:hypothetical protein